MIKVKSPLLREIIDEAMQENRREVKRETKEEALATFLVARFGAEARAVKAKLRGVDDARLEELLVLAGTCPDLDTFRKELAPRRGKRGV